ncbi:hypothetical protein LPJ66_006129 [Kickxella alabastrina]|uniref:Uncharacterized protein n=1 Tax=Kickxella alabastrina TaxID=61397 RepID=A0ACC1IGX1_9FUNG|nr:hypothetical protein LPJ66_006129 [Kickxella alabastrina]
MAQGSPLAPAETRDYTTLDKLAVLSLVSALDTKDWDKIANVLRNRALGVLQGPRAYTRDDCQRIYQTAIGGPLPGGQRISGDRAVLGEALNRAKGQRLCEIRDKLGVIESATAKASVAATDSTLILEKQAVGKGESGSAITRAQRSQASPNLADSIAVTTSGAVAVGNSEDINSEGRGADEESAFHNAPLSPTEVYSTPKEEPEDVSVSSSSNGNDNSDDDKDAPGADADAEEKVNFSERQPPVINGAGSDMEESNGLQQLSLANKGSDDKEERTNSSADSEHAAADALDDLHSETSGHAQAESVDDDDNKRLSTSPDTSKDGAHSDVPATLEMLSNPASDGAHANEDEFPNFQDTKSASTPSKSPVATPDPEARESTEEAKMEDIGSPDIAPAEEEVSVRSPPVSATASKSTASAADEQQLKNWKKNITTVWREISGHRYGSMFIGPIKSADAPNYYDVIRQPIDLKTIKNRIRDEEITTTVEFYRDIMHMLMNALMYNAEDTEVYQMAMEMIPDAQACIEQLLQTEAAVNNPKGSAIAGSGSSGASASASLVTSGMVGTDTVAAGGAIPAAVVAASRSEANSKHDEHQHEGEDSDESMPAKRRRRAASGRAAKHLRA